MQRIVNVRHPVQVDIQLHDLQGFVAHGVCINQFDSCVKCDATMCGLLHVNCVPFVPSLSLLCESGSMLVTLLCVGDVCALFRSTRAVFRFSMQPTIGFHNLQ